jgi:hypothetical protein
MNSIGSPPFSITYAGLNSETAYCIYPSFQQEYCSAFQHIALVPLYVHLGSYYFPPSSFNNIIQTPVRDAATDRLIVWDYHIDFRLDALDMHVNVAIANIDVITMIQKSTRATTMENKRC